MAEFAHLHLHTQYSLLDGVGRIDEYIRRAHETGVQHMAVTDHGVMYGAMEWHRAATKAGLHPIIGVEAYLAEGSARVRERKSYHLLLLAENETGYRNLLKLSSMAQLEGYYYRPRIDLEMLQDHHEGLIATSACLGGPVANNFLHGNPQAARDYAGKLAEIFGPERFFIEIQDHGIREQRTTNADLIPLARSLGLPIVATNDVHYCSVDDAPLQDVLVCVQTNTTLQDEKRLKSESDQLYFKSPEEMERVFGEIPEAMANTIRIAEMCSLDLGFKGYQLPNFDVPPGYTTDSYLEELCLAGVRALYGHSDGEVGERLDYELRVIREMGFTNYFLVVWDFVRFAKEQGILVGPGRGSAAGSIVTYSLGITALDPLKYGLIFERFLNPSRISMPDIDIDFADDRRQEVIDYVVRKYGDDRVAQIVTFGTMAAKGSVRDVARAMGMSFGEADRVAKLIPVGPGVTIESALEKVPELRGIYENEPQLRELIDTAQRLEGIARHSSTHAAGVVISRDPLVEHVPLQRAGGKSEGEVTTQYPMGELESLGLLKMDFLGLTTLTVLGKAVELAQPKMPGLTIETIPLDDPAAYAALRRGETVGVFQLEGGMTTRMTVDVAPDCFEDLIALMALIRPGPMEMAPDYIARKHGRTEIVYDHPDVESVLRETYGVALYQEQVMQIANVLAGFSMAEADGLRKAMGKKLPEEMAKYRDRFLDGCGEHGLARPLATRIWDMIERFAGYGFNKAHSAAYAVIAAQTAYLKTNFPVEFMAALMSTDIGNTDKIVDKVAECRRVGIPVLPPDVNHSFLEFTVEAQEDGREGVRFGLAAIKNVGEGAAQSIIDVRRELPGGRFTDLGHFCDSVNWNAVNKRTLESLARSGALDCLGDRSSILDGLEAAMAAGQQRWRAADRGQMGLFDLGGGDAGATTGFVLAPAPTLPQRELLAGERELIGVYLSAHPLDSVPPQEGTRLLSDLPEASTDGKFRTVAMVTSIRRLQTRTNKTMAVLGIEDQFGSSELVLFPDSYDQFQQFVEVDRILLVSARVDQRGEDRQLICESLTDQLADAPVTLARTRPFAVHLRINTGATPDDDIDLMHQVNSVLGEFEGDDQLVIRLDEQGSETLVRSRTRRVHWCDELRMALEGVLGAGNVWREGGEEIPARIPA